MDCFFGKLPYSAAWTAGLAGLQAAVDEPSKVRGVQLMNISLRLLHINNQPAWKKPFVKGVQTVFRDTPLGVFFFNQLAKKDVRESAFNLFCVYASDSLCIYAQPALCYGPRMLLLISQTRPVPSTSLPVVATCQLYMQQAATALLRPSTAGAHSLMLSVAFRCFSAFHVRHLCTR